MTYLECPCCGHPDCVPEGKRSDELPDRPTWWDDQQVTCPACKCKIRVRVTDDFAEDARASAECMDDTRDQDCPCGGPL